MSDLTRRVWTALVDLLFPPQCGICGAGGGFLCGACERKLPPAAPPRCSHCWRICEQAVCHDCLLLPSPLDGIRSVYVYDGGARTLVHQLKYRSLHALAQPMGELLAACLARDPLPVDLLVPVPLHGRRRRRRGFNQSELLCNVISQRTGMAVDRRSLRRRRNTRQQIHAADAFQREEFVRGAFTCEPFVTAWSVLLIDDVFTTGATLRECATSLRTAGAQSVWALTFAHTD